LSKINEALARKVQARNEYDKTIQETEAAYMKILESSQTLLHVLKVCIRKMHRRVLSTMLAVFLVYPSSHSPSTALYRAQMSVVALRARCATLCLRSARRST
jgi:hypothetical protein